MVALRRDPSLKSTKTSTLSTDSKSSPASGRNAASNCSVWTRYQGPSQLPGVVLWLIGRVRRADSPSSTALFWHASGVNSDLVPDDLWERIAPLIPTRPPRRHRFPSTHLWWAERPVLGRLTPTGQPSGVRADTGASRQC